MKCSAMKLTNKQDHKTKLIQRNDNTNTYIIFPGKRQSYYYSFGRTRPMSKNDDAKLAITTLSFPDNISFNTGSSIEKWSKKTPRLKSGQYQNITKDDENFCYQSLESSFFLDLDEDEQANGTDVTEDTPNIANISNDSKKSTKSAVKTKNRPMTKKKKCKSKKIKFEISAPPSPTTSQVIRVDLTSNVSVEEFRGKDDDEQVRMIDEGRKELKRNLNSGGGREMYDGDDDFIVRCRQLALKQRRR